MSDSDRTQSSDIVGREKACRKTEDIKSGHFQFFRIFWSRTGPRDPSRCVGIAEISLGARSKWDLVDFLSKNGTFVEIQVSKRYLSVFRALDS